MHLIITVSFSISWFLKW